MAGGLNLYQFNGNNPVAYTDPFGLCPWCVGAAVGAIIGGGGRALYNYANDQPLGEGVLASAAVGAVVGGTLGAAAGALGGGTAAAVAASGETVLLEGGRQAVRAALKGGVEGITSGQAANVTRALARGAVDNVTVTAGSGGTITAALTRAGRDGHQVLTKVIDAAGNTVRMAQTAYDKAGKLVHGEIWK